MSTDGWTDKPDKVISVYPPPNTVFAMGIKTIPQVQ